MKAVVVNSKANLQDKAVLCTNMPLMATINMSTTNSTFLSLNMEIQENIFMKNHSENISHGKR